MISNATAKSVVLVVDDQPDDLRATVAVGLADRVEFDLVHPSEVKYDQVAAADLVLVDYQLDNWRDRDRLEMISVKPQTGLALATVLRECVDRKVGIPPTAFALHTAHLTEAQGRLSLADASARHVLARLNNLEWVFPKTDPQRYDQMVLLAGAVRQLPSWPGEGDRSSFESVGELLRMDGEADWFHRCWREVRECRPPIHYLAGGGHGMLFIRWLLHQVMPYPCFLWGVHWVAARLRLPVAVLGRVAAGSSRLADDLRSMRYSGVLAGFVGDRWWRGAVEHYVWGLCEGDAERLGTELDERAGERLVPVDMDRPVVSVGRDLQPSEEFVSTGTAVRLCPDQWPVFADPPWVSISTVVDDAALRAVVHPLDLYRLPQ